MPAASRQELNYGADYFTVAVDNPTQVIRVARERLRESGVKYDTIVGTGLSGAVIVPLMARMLRKKWALIRKPKESRHSADLVVGRIGKRWLFVDDFIATGSTLDRVQEVIRKESRRYSYFETEYVGAYLYNGYNPRTKDFGMFVPDNDDL